MADAFDPDKYLSDVGANASPDALMNGVYPDTGRIASNPGERLDSVTGAPIRAAIGAMQQGDFSGAPAAAWQSFNADPQSHASPSGEQLIQAAGVTNPYIAKGLGMGLEAAANPLTWAGDIAPGVSGSIESVAPEAAESFMSAKAYKPPSKGPTFGNAGTKVIPAKAVPVGKVIMKAEGGDVSGFNPDSYIQSASTPQQEDTSGFDPDSYLKDAERQQYNTPEQTALAGAEAIAKGALGPLATAGEKYLLGVPEAGIAGREREHPILSTAAQVGGFLGSALTGVGIAPVLAKAGQLAAAGVGLGHLAQGASMVSRIGSAAVSQAAEMALLESGNEISKQIVNDPNTSAETAMSNIGLATALGAAGGAAMTGVVSPLWKATIGPRVEGALGALAAKFGGIEGTEPVANNLAAKAGVDIPAEFSAKVSGDPRAELPFSQLSQTDTTISGRKFQKNLNNFREDLGNSAVQALGHESGYTQNIPDLDKYNTGVKIADSLHSELSPTIKSINDAYDSVNTQFKAAPMAVETLQDAADKVAQLSLDQGWHKSADRANETLRDEVLKMLPKQENAADIKNFISNLRSDNPFGSKTYGAARDIAKILGDAQGNAISSAIAKAGGTAEESANAVAKYQALKGKYAVLMDNLDAINEHLHVGKYDGPKTFLSALKDLSTTNGEAVLNRLSGANRANILDLLAKNAPETLAKVRQYHVDKLLDAAGGANLNPNALVKKFNDLTPQLKDLIANPEGQDRLGAIGKILEGLNDATHNHPNTARTAQKLDHGSVTPLTMLAALVGHGSDAVLAHVGKLGFNEGKDALRYSMIKFLGSQQPVESEGFASMANFMHNAVKGDNALTKTIESVFKSGGTSIIDKRQPNQADRDKLDKIVSTAQDKPMQAASKLTDGKLGHYMPDHQTALVNTAVSQAQYLIGLKPKAFRSSPLDREIEPNKSAVARYNRALDIAYNPNTVLQHVKDGTLQKSDIQDLSSMYPALYQNMQQRLSNEMIKVHAGESQIPYTTRIGISLFLGQPMDTSMNPASIIAAQPKPQPMPQQKPAKGTNTKAIGKSNSMYQTPEQNAEKDRSTRD